jgi:hypothetical protein
MQNDFPPPYDKPNELKNRCQRPSTACALAKQLKLAIIKRQAENSRQQGSPRLPRFRVADGATK